MLSILLRVFLGRPLITFFRSVADASNPANLAPFAISFILLVLGWMGEEAVRLQWSNAFFWPAWATAIGAVLGAHWLDGRDNRFPPR